MNVLLLSHCLLLLLLPSNVAGQFTAAPPTCPDDTFTLRCTVTGEMSGTTLWRVALSTTSECPLLHRLTSTSICGPNDAFTAASGTGFGTNGPSFSSTLSGIATSTLDGTLVECFGPANNIDPGNRVNGSTLQIVGPPSVPILSCVDLSEDISGAVNVTVSWTLSGGDSADFYLIIITTNAPHIPYGGSLNITTASVTQNKLTGFMADYEYNITVRGVNCGNQEGSGSEPLTIIPQVPAAPTSCNITLMYDQPSGNLQFINGTWVLMPDSVSSRESCQGPRGRITWYQISFQTGLFMDTENVSIAACTARKCSHTFNLSSNVPASYDSVSVAAVNVVGVGPARTCTMQTISTSNNLLTGGMVDVNSPDNATLICTFLCEFTGSAHCQVNYGTDPTYMDLPYSAKSTETGTAGDTLSVVLREQLNTSTVYYYNVSAVSGDVTVVVQGIFTTPLYSVECNEAGLTDQGGTENTARCTDRGFVKTLFFSDGSICYNGTTEGSTALYICNDGFALVGNEARVCQSGGNWSGSIPVCTNQIGFIVGGVIGGVLLIIIIILAIVVMVLGRKHQAEKEGRHRAEQERKCQAEQDARSPTEDQIDHSRRIQEEEVNHLHRAVRDGDWNEVIHILDKGADVNVKDDNGMTPLHCAAERARFTMVEYLVGKQAIINIRNHNRQTPLHLAAKEGHDYTVESLVKCKAEIDVKDENGMTPLHLAVESNRIKIVECLVNRGAALNLQDNNGWTPLHIAATKGRDYTVECLVNKGADINIKSTNGLTPLHLAVKGGWIAIVKYLVDQGADVNIPDHDDRTPLHTAAIEGRDYTVEYLVENGAKTDDKDKEGATPLHMAVERNHIKIVKCLVDKSAGVNIQDYKKRTPLHVAAEKGRDYTVEFLVKKGAKIDIKDNNGMTPLHLAVTVADIKMVECLVDQEAVVNIKDENGWTALHIAAKEGHDYTVEWLLKKGAQTDIKDKDGMIPLHLAVKNARIKIVECLVHQNVACINTQDLNERTPLHIAAEEGRDYTVECLVNQGADINIKDKDWMTPLHMAVGKAHIKIVEYLLDKKANVKIQDRKGRTPLHIAAEQGRDYTVKCLVMHSADVNIKDKEGMTPLHMAVKEGCIKIVKYLVDKGASINIQDNEGRIPLHIAAEEGRDYTVEWLAGKGANINTKDNDGMTPLHVAVKHTQFKIVEHIIGQAAADINIQDNRGRTALHIATIDGRDYTVKCLVKKGADINIKDKDGKIPLDLAVKKNEKIVEYLTKAGGEQTEPQIEEANKQPEWKEGGETKSETAL